MKPDYALFATKSRYILAGVDHPPLAGPCKFRIFEPFHSPKHLSSKKSVSYTYKYNYNHFVPLNKHLTYNVP